MLKALFLLLLLFFVSCSDSGSVSSSADSEISVVEDSLMGMVRVKTNEQVLYLGTNDSLVRSEERPRMQVSLDYDFSIGRHEVTCGEFNTLMKKSTGLSLECENDSIPATNLTYYDAVLFANERSKKEKFDTAYTYRSAVFDSEKHCTSLEGFAFHPATKAYRLPTEAEWVLVAGMYWNLAEGWTADNSDYKLHSVCRKVSEDVPVCDMVGNAMEWVNDWLGHFRDTAVVNFVGAPDGGALGVRIVKGGSFQNMAESITLYGRGDVYTVTSSTRADYVGFRLAFGDVPNAVWMGDDGRATTSRIVPLANAVTLRSHTGTYKAKLAFRNDLSGNIAYIDYAGGILSVTEIVDTIDAYHPDISPDGEKVAFCTKFEGVGGKSELYVRDLNAEGSNLVKLKVESAAIPRWRVLANGDTVIVYVNDAGVNNDESAFMASSTWQVKFSKGKFGKPQKLFDGAYHGGISEDNTLAVTGARLLRSHMVKSGTAKSKTTETSLDTVWYAEEQACNVSMAKDSSKRTLFLDFGGKKGRKFVGENYRTHERLLVVNASGKLVQSVGAPAGYTFDHSEWDLGGKNLAVATLVNANGVHQKIVLVNLTDSTIVDLAEGDELWHPCLWIKRFNASSENVSLDADSAGFYLTEDGDLTAMIFRYKMELLWNYRDSASVIVVGSSRPQQAILPNKMRPEFRTLNLTNVPNMMASSEYIVENYVLPHVSNLKYLVISLDIDLWYHDETSDYNFFYSEYKKYPGYVYDENHDFWKSGVPEGLGEMTTESYGVNDLAEMFRYYSGYCYAESISWEENPTVEYDSTWMDYLSSNYRAAFGHLENILKMAEKRGVYVIGVVFPQSPNFKKTGAFGRYGIRRSEAPALLKELQDLEKEYPHFVYWDENQMGDHDYDDSMANNKDHMSKKGAEQFTERLNLLLEKLEKK